MGPDAPLSRSANVRARERRKATRGLPPGPASRPCCAAQPHSLPSGVPTTVVFIFPLAALIKSQDYVIAAHFSQPRILCRENAKRKYPNILLKLPVYHEIWENQVLASKLSPSHKRGGKEEQERGQGLWEKTVQCLMCHPRRGRAVAPPARAASALVPRGLRAALYAHQVLWVRGFRRPRGRCGSRAENGVHGRLRTAESSLPGLIAHTVGPSALPPPAAVVSGLWPTSHTTWLGSLGLSAFKVSV